jgi:hypothetical protein
MSWEQLTTEDVLSEFTIAEAASIRTLQGSGSGSGLPFANIDFIVVNVTDEVRGYIAAGGYALDETSDPRTIPVSLFEDAIAIARWRLLIATPSFRQLQTDERRQAFEEALKKLALIAATKFVIIPPDPDINPRTGQWNSENKILMRTHPVPRPATQFTPQINTYANPISTPDTTNTQNSGTLSIGTTYSIIFYVTGDDFTNVGGTNVTGAVFVATDTTPTVWTNQSELQML